MEAPEAPTGDPIADIVLTPGDLLYLPRGWWHAVSADQGTASLHLTFGLAMQTGAEFLGRLCDDLRASVTVRADVPRFGTPEERANYLAAVRKDVLAALDDPAALDRWERSLDATHPGRPRLSLPHLAAVPAEPSITVQATVPRARIEQDDQAVTFAGAGNEWTSPSPSPRSSASSRVDRRPPWRTWPPSPISPSRRWRRSSPRWSPDKPSPWSGAPRDRFPGTGNVPGARR
ncbi:cupin domain-containing protein [Streptomyces sp. RerS4]|uniref:JmjC domain-containing protein n=1 Tax=Streptomyces sp. RerS4 TaxID=2942449 RepID=UPI00201C781E|nr:cupin domain-containing protein [Streptomyces sp. RerS4]UQX05382.1 cupin domain-containing protein [Streptomyces sp. RerS4]